VVVYFVIFKIYMCFLKCTILEFYFYGMFIMQLRHHLSAHAFSCVGICRSFRDNCEQKAIKMGGI